MGRTIRFLYGGVVLLAALVLLYIAASLVWQAGLANAWGVVEWGHLIMAALLSMAAAWALASFFGRTR